MTVIDKHCVSTYLNENEVRKLDDFRKEGGFRSRSEALKWLINENMKTRINETR